MFLPEKNNTDEKEINRQGNGWMFFDNLPGVLHLFAPVYVIKDENRVRMGFSK